MDKKETINLSVDTLTYINKNVYKKIHNFIFYIQLLSVVLFLSGILLIVWYVGDIDSFGLKIIATSILLYLVFYILNQAAIRSLNENIDDYFKSIKTAQNKHEIEYQKVYDELISK